MTLPFISGQASGDLAKSHFRSGVYEGLMFATDAHGNITGYYQEKQRVGVTKNCSFSLIGNATSDEIEVTTWSNRILPGVLKNVKGGVELKIPDGRDHSGCGLVLLPQISDGISLDMVALTKWSDLRKIRSKTVNVYSKPSLANKTTVFLAAGEIVGVVTEKDHWLQMETRDGEIKGWILADEATKLRPPR
jgi:hypothetical protein